MRRAVRALCGAVLLAGPLVAGCGLPLADGVQRPGEVAAAERLPEPINVLPPGPQPGATPEGVVLGFLTAQISARDGHGIARSFLAPDERQGWRADAGVTVYEPRTATVGAPVPDGDGVVVDLQLDVVGHVAADGAASVQEPQRTVQRYRLRQGAGEQWQLVQVPQGLTLSPAGRDRAYEPLSVHFLAPRDTSGVTRHLVADLLQLPADGDRAAMLVDRLLAGPSSALAGSADSAVPEGARLRAPVRTGPDGEVVVDLSEEVAALPQDRRQELSAQLVWTLRQVPDATRLRLLSGGEPFLVGGTEVVQLASAWAAFAPEGPVERPAGLALVGGMLTPLDPPVVERGPLPGPADQPGVVDHAVDPRLGRIAVLTGTGSRRRVLTGPVAGPLEEVLADDGLRSPSWGSGDRGLFLLRTGARPGLLLLRGVSGQQPLEVAVEGLPELGGQPLLRVARDGVRLALVGRGVLHVGRIERDGERLRVVGLRELASGVLDVAWRTGTTLSVLVEDDDAPLLPLLEVSVDGTTSEAAALLGVAQGEPVALAAYGDQPLLVETRLDDVSTIYADDGGRGFEVRLRDAVRPAYPR